MTTHINSNILKSFLLEKVGRTLDYKEAVSLDVKNEYNKMLEETQDTLELYLDDFLDDTDSDLYQKFATLYIEEKDNEAEAKNEEKEKEKQNKVQAGNNGAGV